MDWDDFREAKVAALRELQMCVCCNDHIYHGELTELMLHRDHRRYVACLPCGQMCRIELRRYGEHGRCLKHRYEPKTGCDSVPDNQARMVFA